MNTDLLIAVLNAVPAFNEILKSVVPVVISFAALIVALYFNRKTLVQKQIDTQTALESFRLAKTKADHEVYVNEEAKKKDILRTETNLILQFQARIFIYRSMFDTYCRETDCEWDARELYESLLKMVNEQISLMTSDVFADLKSSCEVFEPETHSLPQANIRELSEGLVQLLDNFNRDILEALLKAKAILETPNLKFLERHIDVVIE